MSKLDKLEIVAEIIGNIMNSLLIGLVILLYIHGALTIENTNTSYPLLSPTSIRNALYHYPILSPVEKMLIYIDEHKIIIV